MSATNRGGSPYAKGGVYYTDPKVASAIVEGILPIRPHHRVVDGHAGGGAFLEPLVRAGHPPSLLYAMDADRNAPALVQPAPAFHRVCQSFLDVPVVYKGQTVQGADPWPAWWPMPDWVIGNPPYGETVEGRNSALPVTEHHVRRALDVAQVGVAFLLRLSLTAAGWFSTLPAPRMVCVLRPRPSFTGGETDAASYALIWWQVWPTWQLGTQFAVYNTDTRLFDRSAA